MSPTASDERRSGERRIHADRRAPGTRRAEAERRHDERRIEYSTPDGERREGRERRRGQRRRISDRRRAVERRFSRRRGTPSPYTAEEAARIQRMFATRGSRTACPACGASFTLGRLRRRGRDTARRVRCLACDKAAIVANSWMARVMVVEDKAVIRDTIRAILTNAGHEVVEAPDAATGLRAYRENPADVVFVNVFVTGEMDGGDFIRKLRQEFGDARIVAVSGRTSYGHADPLAVAKQLGAARTIRMPFSRTEMLRALDEARQA